MVAVGGELSVVPTEIIKNQERFIKFVDDYEITCGFFTSSFCSLFQKFPESIKKIFLGGEPVKGIFYENISLYCFYGQSETGGALILGAFLMDRKKDETPEEIMEIEEEGAPLCGSAVGQNLLRGRGCTQGCRPHRGRCHSCRRYGILPHHSQECRPHTFRRVG